ncbi:hypothetical protein LY78DRAFT_656385 [Colletotrichum sublineola]|nr:hypothetical protein LY78DRAFT_656385 [Colletotrichum sublineola]
MTNLTSRYHQSKTTQWQLIIRAFTYPSLLASCSYHRDLSYEACNKTSVERPADS